MSVIASSVERENTDKYQQVQKEINLFYTDLK